MAYNYFTGLSLERLEELHKFLEGWRMGCAQALCVRMDVQEALYEGRRTLVLGALRQEFRADQKAAVSQLMGTGLSHLEASELVCNVLQAHAKAVENDIFARKVW